MNKATQLSLGECGLVIYCGSDGVWLTFTAASGKSASINVEGLIARAYSGLTANALMDWCDDQQKLAAQIREDNGQFGVGA